MSDALERATEALQVGLDAPVYINLDGGKQFVVATLAAEHARTILAALREREQAVATAREQGAAEYAASMDAERAGWQQRIADEREACAEMCESAARPEPRADGSTYYAAPMLHKLAAAIRARGKEAT